MVDKELLRHKLMFIRKRLNTLREKMPSVTAQELQNNEELFYLLLHYLQLAVQAAIDVAGHVVAENEWGPPSSYGDMFAILREHRVISGEEENVLREFVGTRNVIVHGYDEVSPEKIYLLLTKELPALDAFAATIDKYCHL